MAPKIKLVYFNARARGEVARLALKLGGVDFEDQRVGFEEWGALKPSTPFGHIPVLWVDDKVQISESGAVARYAANLAGLEPSCPLQRAKVDMVVDAFIDVFTAIVSARFEKDPDRKAAAMEKFAKETQPTFLGNVEKLLKAEGSGLYVGKKITLADLMSFHCLSEFQGADPAVLDKFPLLKAHTAKIGSEPKIKAWVEIRPESAM